METEIGTDKRRKIAVFEGMDLRNYGGAEKDLIRWASQLKDDFDITIFSRENDHGPKRVSIEFVEQQLRGVKIVWYRGIKLRLLRDIWFIDHPDLSSYDKVYAMCEGVLAIRYIRRHSKKILIGIHSPVYLIEKPIESQKAWKRLLFKFYHKLLVKSILKVNEVRVQNLDDYQKIKAFGFAGKIWNVPPSMFDTTPEPILENKFRVVWLNRIEFDKRPEKLIQIAQMNPDIAFEVIGSGNLQVLFEGPDKPKNIDYKGFVTDEELEELLTKASAYISTSAGENFGMSAVEALAHGVPTIVYDVKGLREYNSFVVRNEDEANRVLRDLLDLFRNGDYLKFRQKIRVDAMEKFSDSIVLQQIKEMMEY